MMWTLTGFPTECTSSYGEVGPPKAVDKVESCDTMSAGSGESLFFHLISRCSGVGFRPSGLTLAQRRYHTGVFHGQIR